MNADPMATMPRSLHPFLIVLIALAAIPGDAGAQTDDTELHIPEPMIFDLVRGLGAKKGELETNVLAEFPINRTASREIEWAPEVEYAFADGLAIEFELPFEDGELEGYKGAFQWTIGQPGGGRFIHGTQFIAVRSAHEESWELTGLYIPAFRFNSVWSVLGMVGLRDQVGPDRRDVSAILLNGTVFAQLSEQTTLGLELNNTNPNDAIEETENDFELLVMPQWHQEFTEHFSLQLGLGGQFADERFDTTFALRAILEF
jgi:hypothetical protein